MATFFSNISIPSSKDDQKTPKTAKTTKRRPYNISWTSFRAKKTLLFSQHSKKVWLISAFLLPFSVYDNFNWFSFFPLKTMKVSSAKWSQIVSDRQSLRSLRGCSKMTSPQKWDFLTPLPPLSPFVTIFGLPPPSHVTGANGDKLLPVNGSRKN